MSIFKTKALLLAISIFVLFSCSDDDDNICTDQVIETTGLESEYNCVNTKFEMDIDLTDDFIIITNQTDFNSRVTGECQPDIDFITYDLLIGKEQLTTGNDSIDYVLTEGCETNTYQLEVTFNQNNTLIAPNLTYHRLIPKLPQGREVTVDITID
ncbi:hypothetical protein ACFQ0R_00730 [Psychroflexus salinarum]|uniref:Lipocalin-like domain-containing protein n=1 Tax=Psychroflexus salinarum TaxID=546024 RepID=A0ABW3GL05_9FLAO